MSHLLDRLRYFKKIQGTFSKGHGIVTGEDRQWEDTYRNRWRHDKVVRSTHGVNCTGGCSWKIYVKNGLVAYEMQQTDYPRTRPDMPNHEPRGCQRGASFSWYLYSPTRIKYPLIRGRLLDLYCAERKSGKDPVEAWEAIQSDPSKRKKYTAVRGLGGFVRSSWDEVTEITAAANVYTAKKWGPDRIYGFSPIPAMSMISYAAGSRYLSLIGGACGSFYDWYCDLPPASPQVWGEQTDVPESADWYNSKYIIICGANLPMTRTPDAHFAIESRYNGTKIVSMAPDYAEYVKFADLWMPVKQGTDSAAFLAMGHVALKEFHVDKQDPYFTEYSRKYTDLPMQVMLRKDGDRYISDRFLRASDFANNMGESNNPEWKTVVYDTKSGAFVVPNGSVGFRWGEEGKWNLLEKNAVDQSEIEAELSCIDGSDDVVSVAFPHFTLGESDVLMRNIPVRKLKLASGNVVMLTSVFDLQVAQYGIDRGLGDNLATSYDDESVPYTPAWAEKITGVKRADLERTGREFADNASKTHGKSMVILGAAINHWYHNDMNYRGIMNLLHMCGCVGQSGGGWAHYVGQEKLRPQAGWAPIAFGLDWHRPPRHMASTTYWYFHTDQWRYETVNADELMASTARGRYKGYSLADYNVVSQRLGWGPSAPHFNKNPMDIVDEAEKAGVTDESGVAKYMVEQLKSGDLTFASEDIDAPENHPRNLFVWRANLLGCSAKGHEYFLKHLMGAQNGVMQEANIGADSKEIVFRKEAPVGKLDLMVDINFRLNSTGAYSDIILPTATWYEKSDLNTTDMHPFIHPLDAAVDPAWESRSDWQIFKTIAKKFSELAEIHLGTRKDVVALPMQHDSPMALAQPLGEVKDWKRGECEPVPGKTLPLLKVVERDYANTYKKYTSLGPLLTKIGNGVKGLDWNTEVEYEQLKELNGVIKEEGVSQGLPSLEEDIYVCDSVLQMAPETNGEVAHKSWKALGRKTGIDHNHLCDPRKDEKIRYRDIQAQPRKIITAPTWSGIESEEVSYNACWINIHEHIPLRTLTGRAQFYLDHEWMLDFGEGLCAFRPPVDLKTHENIPDKVKSKPHLTLNWITPHSKWGIHSTYQDNLRMLTLFRGGPYMWVAEVDAKSIGLKDNDWVEAINGNGATVARVVVSQRIPSGAAFMYHAQEKHVNVPGSNTTGKRGGILNSVTRIVPKPTHMIGGYAQLSYAFNYYGTVGSQRDEYVVIHKIEDGDVDWLEGPLTAKRESQINPPGINN
ncbi:MAG: nitrate reductase subunit alpha [Candidatus Thiodiazotropha sp. (ex Lucinoma aequizonata)]|nr:nitrate reductase subunit alpha [Candidatus Thiodiazotropha sp. (ex Lucinoma aequizonata)]MCU7886947.1 nitrate reductase subunit alpha [Candidatus Thiodiazotropha sp. (ex Lucinoma aequizonata)]MCU7896771.1 nitrate reductase subunit alpha [Candidatus Thiodiazotropha sp. (ex Lucinoma aequizonata)]MCU7897977.1 nitrate reductase subunit alpha [Candidatus Thiodiazotropha sp. (ex Lucinoma aequizonata)]MCU7903704.1 nitrate reductase subunit alpha [Candidatus Thiodiazotropha sp. (ex Lucinoma aequizo